ncbi:ornithine decarboxylase-like [Haliotis cracherodii]|uniref:ornithine decarboxylase-like n=1 Tax=Haliotis cracherodii TaxID=6455 RepID=UPI0039E81F34
MPPLAENEHLRAIDSSCDRMHRQFPMDGQQIHVAHPCRSKLDIIADIARSADQKGCDDAFYIVDLGDLVNNYQRWRRLMPRVTPFYAVKCNADPIFLRVLSQLGAGFDCASKCEIETVLQMGVAPGRVVYANPCKQTSHLEYAARNNIDLMTFDNEAELYKVKSTYPHARLLMRIVPPAGNKVMYDLSAKFGCHLADVSDLLRTAKNLDLDVVGVSFHVGSGIKDPEVFATSLQRASSVFGIAAKMGFTLDTLDVGGGIYGHRGAPVSFEKVATALNRSLDEFFPVSSNVKVMAEPGRYFAASPFTLVTSVIAKRKCTAVVGERDLNELKTLDPENPRDVTPTYMYYINDGVYGSLSFVLSEDTCMIPTLVKVPASDVTFTSSLWGPTCDGSDCVLKEGPLPELQIGDWFYFENMGAYSISLHSRFNGMAVPECHYMCEEEIWETVLKGARQINGYK